MILYIFSIVFAYFVVRGMFKAAALSILLLVVYQQVTIPILRAKKSSDPYAEIKKAGDELAKSYPNERMRSLGKETKFSHDWMAGPKESDQIRILTADDIKYKEGGPLMLVILGHVFDVSSGAKAYTPGSGYFGFIGQDASRAFVTGQFDKEGLISDVSGLSSSDYKGLADWLKFYLDHKEYVHVGYLVGRFFDENGWETQDMAKFKAWVIKARQEDDAEHDLKKLFPPCNVQWSSEEGSTFECTRKSGGISRNWTGVPRLFYQEGSTSSRCACVHPNYLADPRVTPYNNCDPKSLSCKVPPAKSR